MQALVLKIKPDVIGTKVKSDGLILIFLQHVFIRLTWIYYSCTWLHANVITLLSHCFHRFGRSLSFVPLSLPCLAFWKGSFIFIESFIVFFARLEVTIRVIANLHNSESKSRHDFMQRVRRLVAQCLRACVRSTSCMPPDAADLSRVAGQKRRKSFAGVPDNDDS